MVKAKRSPRHSSRLARGGEWSKLTNYEKRNQGRKLLNTTP